MADHYTCQGCLVVKLSFVICSVMLCLDFFRFTTSENQHDFYMYISLLVHLALFHTACLNQHSKLMTGLLSTD